MAHGFVHRAAVVTFEDKAAMLEKRGTSHKKEEQMPT